VSAGAATPYAIHPAANMFPMLAEADLAALAEDIRVNGQGEPVVIWDGQVLDGRNRLAACELAGVEPLTRTLKACPDPVAFVLSANLRRRHLRHIDRVRLAWLRKGHWQDVLKKRQVEAGAAGSEGGRGKKKTPRGDSPEGFADQRWYDLAAKETEVKGDAVKTYDEVMAAECPALSALVNDEAMALDPASKLAREVRGERLTVETLTDALAADKGRALLDSLKKPREGKAPAPPSDNAAPAPSSTTSAPAAPVAGTGLSPQHPAPAPLVNLTSHPAVDAIASAPTRDALDAAYTAANGASLSKDAAEEAGKVYQRKVAELRAQAPATTPTAPTHEQVDLFTQAAPAAPSTPRGAHEETASKETSPALFAPPTVPAADAAEVAALRAEVESLRAELAGLRRWSDEIASRAGAADEGSVKKAMRLIALAGSNNENEARSAAYQACRVIREKGLLVATTFSPDLVGDTTDLDELRRSNATRWAKIWRDLENMSRGVQS